MKTAEQEMRSELDEIKGMYAQCVRTMLAAAGYIWAGDHGVARVLLESKLRELGEYPDYDEETSP